MANSDWQSKESYLPARSLDRVGLAWEFLRRNGDYQREYRGAQASQSQIVEPLPSLGTGGAIDPVWGLSFRCQPETRCLAASGLVVAGDPCLGCAACSG